DPKRRKPARGGGWAWRGALRLSVRLVGVVAALAGGADLLVRRQGGVLILLLDRLVQILDAGEVVAGQLLPRLLLALGRLILAEVPGQHDVLAGQLLGLLPVAGLDGVGQELALDALGAVEPLHDLINRLG